MIDFIKKHSTITIIFLFVISIFLMYFTNQYDISSKNLELINNGNIEQKTIWYLSNQTLFFNILGIVVLNIAVAVFISSFFLRYIEKSEKVLITLNWFREDIDITHLQDLTSISEISKEMLNNLNIKGN